jgi:HSP20 family protein
MLPTRYDPLLGMSPLLSFRRDMDQLFSDFFRDVAPAGEGQEPDMAIAPRLDLVEKMDGYEVQAELPGVDADDVKVNVTGNTLMIEAEKREESEEAGEAEGTMRLRERVYRRYQRAITLPESIDAGKIDASLRNGVLTLVLPKSEQAKPRQIQVKPGAGAKAKQIEKAAEPKMKKTA